MSCYKQWGHEPLNCSPNLRPMEQATGQNRQMTPLLDLMSEKNMIQQNLNGLNRLGTMKNSSGQG